MAVVHWKKDKVCPVCGKTFKGTAKAQVCGSTCRSRLKRLIEAGGKPEYYLIAKGKGQKVPDLTGVKKPKTPSPFEKTIWFSKPTIESFDGSATEVAKIDEIGILPKVMSAEQIYVHNAEIDKKIAEIGKEPLPHGIMPRAHKLNREIRIDELKSQKL